MKGLIAVVLALTLGSQAVWAGSANQKHTEKVRNKISRCLDDGRNISVEMYDNRKLAGTVTEAAQDDFVLTNAAGSTTLNYADVKNIHAPMDPHKRSMIVSAVVLGGLLGTLFAAAANDR